MQRLLIWVTSPAQVKRLFDNLLRCLRYRRGGRLATLADARRVLIVRLDHLGDLILTSAFLREFRKNWPEAEITLLVDPASRPLVEQCPYIDHIEVYARFRPCAFGRVRRFVRELYFAGRHLWPHRFDLAVVPRWDTQLFREGLMAYLSGAKWRVGFSEEGNTIVRTEESYEVLYTHLAPSGVPQHEVRKSLELLTWMGGTVSETHTEVWLDVRSREFAASILSGSVTNEPVFRVVIMPGSSSASRRWPAERFGEIAAWIVNDFGWQVVLIGSPGEAALGRIVETCCPSGVVNLIGRTTPKQAAAVIERCQLYVGNDSGPMHMAAALGVPVVEISSHPADGSAAHERAPVRFSAWDVPAWIAQPAAGLEDCRDFCVPAEMGMAHCVLAVTIDQVKDLILKARGSALEPRRARTVA
jgi:ADP-heptose:LPS heptosyltransferase